MKVASPNPSNKKKSPLPPGKAKKSSNQKAADVLKKALQEGKLNDVLWKEETEVSRLVQKRRASSLAEKRSTTTSFDIEREMTLNDAVMLDDVAIWNRLLQARVLHTMRNLGPHWNEQFKEGDYNNREDESDDSDDDSDSDSDSDSSDEDSDEDDEDDDYEDEDGDDEEDGDDDQDDETEGEDASSMRGSSDKTEGVANSQSAKQRKLHKKKMLKRKRRKRRRMGKANQEQEETRTDAPEDTTSERAQAPPRTSSDENQSTAASKKSRKEKKKDKKKKKSRTRFSIEVLEIGDVQKKMERKQRRRERRKNKKMQSEAALMEGLHPGDMAEAHVLSLEEQLKALDTLTVRDRASEGYSKKTWRVADMIKSSRISQIRPFSSSPTPSEPKSEANKQESPTYNDSSDEEDRESPNQPASEVKWAGTVARPNKHAAMVDLSAVRNRKNSHQVSLDVVAGLFQMSNELRQERESIMSRGAVNKEGTPNDIEDFLNRKTTLKYSEQLDEVAMTKQEAFLTQKRAAVLRLKKTAIQYKVPQPPNITRFTKFWSVMQEENDRRGGGNLYLELNRLPSTHTDSDEGESSDFSFNENVVMEEKSNKLETVLEENLGLLFQTKARAAMTSAQRIPSRPSSVASFRSDESKGILLRQRSQARPPKSKLHSVSKEDSVDVEMNDSDIDTHSVKNITTPSQIKTPSLAAAINRLRHLGVLAEGKLRHTYGLTKRRSEEWKREEENRKIEAEKRKKELEEQQERLRRAQFLRDQQQYMTRRGSQEIRNVNLDFDGPNAELQSTHELLRTESRFASQVSNASNTVTNIQLTMDIDNSRPRANIPQSSSFDPYEAFLSNPTPVKQYEAAGKIIHQRIMDLSALMSGSDEPMLPNPIPSVSPPAPQAKKKAKKKEKNDDEDVVDDNVFLTQFISYVEIGNQDDLDQDFLNPNSLHGPSYQIVDPHRILPRPYEPSTSRGKWGYDPLLSVQPAQRLLRREDEERINEIERKRRRWYQEDYVHKISRNEYPLAKPKEVRKEILFDQREKTLLLVTYEEDQPKDCSEVPITSVFLTDSVFPDMLMLRTYDTFNVPSGYLGTFFLDQWAKIEREINASLLEEYVLSLAESEKDVGQQGSSVSSAIIIPRFGLLQGGIGLDGLVGKAPIPLYAIRPPPPLPAAKKEAILQAKEASIMKRKGRFERLLPSQAAIENNSSIHTKQSSAIQVEEEPVSIVSKQKKSVRIATETSLVSSQTSNIQQMPTNLPPTKQKASPARERGYEASGFAALSQNVSITILGKSLPSAQSSLATYSIASVPSTAMNPMAPTPPPPPSLKKAQSVDDLAIEAARAVKRIPSRPIAPPQTKKPVRSVRLVEQPDIFPARELSSSSSAPLPPFDDSRVTTAGEPAVSEKPLVEEASEEFIFTNASELSDYSDRTSSTAFSFLNAIEDYEAFTYECQVILLIESRRLMQLYFTKKFLQLDLAVNVEMTIYDAAESLAASPEVYGLILASYQDLNYNGDVRHALEMLLPPGMDHGAFSIYVYDLNVDEGQELEILETLEACGVEDVFSPPYTLEVLKDALNVHKRKQDLLMKYSPVKAATKRNKSKVIDVLGPNVYVKGGFS